MPLGEENLQIRRDRMQHGGTGRVDWRGPVLVNEVQDQGESSEDES